jgi:large subunit ribosomal protein L17
MRHNKHHASLGVTREHRESMMSNLAAALITHGRIKTTLTKAKALRPFIEKVITKAKRAAAKTEKRDALHLRRLALRDVRDETALTLLFNEKVKDFANRAGGYTRIYKLGPQRLGDAAELALIEFVKAEDVGYKKGRGRRAAKVRKPKAPKTAAAPAAVAEASTASEAPAPAAPETPPAAS